MALGDYSLLLEVLVDDAHVQVRVQRAVGRELRVQLSDGGREHHRARGAARQRETTERDEAE